MIVNEKKVVGPDKPTDSKSESSNVGSILSRRHADWICVNGLPDRLWFIVVLGCGLIASWFCMSGLLMLDSYSGHWGISNVEHPVLRLGAMLLIGAGLVIFLNSRRRRTEISAIFESAPVMMLLLDKSGCVRRANRSMLRARADNGMSVVGRMCGEALGCQHCADDLRGCGYGPSCGECMIQKAIKDAFGGGKGCHRREVGFVWRHENITEEYSLLVSTSRLQIYGKQRVLLCIEDATDRKLFERQLGHLAHHDVLTGLPNRLLFSDRLTQELAQPSVLRNGLAVMFIDVDRFKVLNETLGKDAGDKLLRETTARLRNCLRDCDMLAKMGGDEFSAILPGVGSIEAADLISSRVLKELCAPVTHEGNELFLSASIGISMFPDHGNDAETLVQNADTAMTRAKESGGNQYLVYSEASNAAMTRKLSLEANLRDALERDELILHYQPRVDIAIKTTLGAEALVRWEHPEMGLLPPSQFIGLAEETGLIVPLTDRVLKMACAQNRAWQDEGFPPISVSVNVSQVYFQQNDIVATVVRVLNETGLEPQYLELEITESALMNNPEEIVEILQKLKDMGVSTSIDDFGTGYSSLAHLQKLPINTLKIDRSFVKNITRSVDDAAVAGAVTAMASNLNLKVVAEGVETIEQLEYLRSIRCDEVQGYFVSPPVPPDEFVALLRKFNSPKEGRKRRAA